LLVNVNTKNIDRLNVMKLLQIMYIVICNM
jgi:hypothetical protein